MADELFTNPKQEATDIRLVLQALNNRWKVPAEIKDKIIEKCSEIAFRDYSDTSKYTKSSSRQAMAALSLLVKIVAQKQEDEHALLKHLKGTDAPQVQLNFNNLSQEDQAVLNLMTDKLLNKPSQDLLPEENDKKEQTQQPDNPEQPPAAAPSSPGEQV